MVAEQARILKEYEDKQSALKAQAAEEERKRQELEAQQQREFESRQRQQQEQERMALEQLQQQQLQQYTNAAAARVNDYERELLAMRGQYERDQLMLEQYDRVCLPD
jgi:tRNA U34 5-carboxymethylaminomethyl modifying GTPase MnmE/TrmE